MSDPAIISALEFVLEHYRSHGSLPPPPANDTPQTGDLITSGAAAKIAGVSKLTIRRWCERFSIGRKVAGRWRVYPSKLRAFMSAQAA